MKTTVKTEAKAIEIFENEINSMSDHYNSDDYMIENTTTECECGQTHALRCLDYAGKFCMIIGICECCGDDYAPVNEIIDYI